MFHGPALRQPSRPWAAPKAISVSIVVSTRPASPLKVGVIDFPPCGKLKFRVLRFSLMVKRGPHIRPQASEGEAQHHLFCWTRCVGQGNKRLVDDAGKIVREARVASEPEALLQVLTNTLYRLKRVGLEARPLSQRLYKAPSP